MAVQWSVVADFDRDGAYEYDLTGDVEAPGSGITIDRGFGKDGIYQISKVTITVTNREGTYVFDNSASALYGKLKPGVPVKVQATYDGADYTLWTGYIQRYRMSGFSASTVPTCAFECTDLADNLVQFSPMNVLVGTRTTREAYEAVAEAAGLLGADYQFTGIQELPLHWVRSADALTAMAQIQQSEMGGQWFVDALGKVRGQGRDARLGIAVSQTWGDGSNTFPRAGTVVVSDEDVISKAAVQANIFVQDADEQVIFEFSRGASNPTPDSLYIEPGAIYGPVSLDYPSPVQQVSELVATTDYTANSAADGSGTDMTASLLVTSVEEGAGFSLTLRNGHATDGLYVTKFQKRGLASNYVPDRPIFTYSLPIDGDKTARGITVQLPFADDSGKPRDFSVQLVRTYRHPYPRLTLAFDAGNHADTMAAMLALELGDLIRYKDTDVTTLGKTYSNDWWYVDHIRISVPPTLAGQTFPIEVELIPSYLFRNLDAIVYDQFERDDASGDLGTSTSYDVWSGDGNMDITGGFARANSDSAQLPVMDLGMGVTDAVVEVLLSEIGSGDEVGVTFRYRDSNNHYRFYIDAGSNEAILERVSEGAVTELSSPAYTVGTAAELRVIYQASRIRCYVDELLVVDTEDAPLFAGTKCGLFARNASGTTKFNEFYGQGLNGSVAVRELRMPEIRPMPLRRPGRRAVA